MLDFLNPFNDIAKDIFRQQPIVIVLFLIFMAMVIIFYALKIAGKQNSEDHKEKGLLINLVKDSNQMFGALREAIDGLRISQEKRNDAFVESLQEQKATNQNLTALNQALANNHSDFVDTITVVLKNQVTGRLDKVEGRVDEIYDIVAAKSDCNDLVLEKIGSLSNDVISLKEYFVNREVKRLEDM